ncbi:hypothetical protein [Christiangramia forsetii]|uniref:Secreted protein n=2 Tax=Christiangramia forsetii TaxID=411153 RepID=A0M1W0_CHRFK|nr:hypothetical protein [Christiangramia forsetii]GGG45222.1 hypothetical protein GCM10011532_31510 [Christiangramia forsetii]CAL66605.1 secreted protein [Christiangramia forsetii KT0803]
MKKLVLLAAFTFGAVFFSNMNAQEISKNALGLRVGDGGGFGAEVSYQRAVGGDNNRLEFDLGWRDGNNYDAVKLVGLYQWVWNIEGGFNWYVGAGAGLGSYDDNRGNDDFDDDGLFALIAGDIGIEYNFDFPLLLSLDLRPEIGFSDYREHDDFTPDIALGIRYQF